MPAASQSAVVLSLVLAVGQALTHIFWRLPGPKSATGLSVAGGITTAYIFLHLLPGLALAEELTVETATFRTPLFLYRVYALALLGVVLFYTLQKGRKLGRLTEGGPSRLNFGLTIAGHAVLSLLVGYLLLRRPKTGIASMVTFSLAMFSHFMRYDLRADYGAAFDRVARWVLAAAVLAGWIGVLAGAVIVTALREDLPEEEKSKPWAFALGAALLTLLVVLAG